MIPNFTALELSGLSYQAALFIEAIAHIIFEVRG